MIATIETETKHYILCPDCNGRIGTIDHLVGKMQRVGPWVCDDCGEYWTIETDGVTANVEKSIGRGKWVDVTATLVLPPQRQPITFTIHTKTHEPIDEGNEYFYNSHACPTNWMRDVVKITIGDNEDPHGLFEFDGIKPGHVDDQHDIYGQRVTTTPPGSTA